MSVKEKGKGDHWRRRGFMEEERRERSKEEREGEDDQEGIWDRQEGKEREPFDQRGHWKRRRRRRADRRSMAWMMVVMMVMWVWTFSLSFQRIYESLIDTNTFFPQGQEALGGDPSPKGRGSPSPQRQPPTLHRDHRQGRHRHLHRSDGREGPTLCSRALRPPFLQLPPSPRTPQARA